MNLGSSRDEVFLEVVIICDNLDRKGSVHLIIFTKQNLRTLCGHTLFGMLLVELEANKCYSAVACSAKQQAFCHHVQPVSITEPPFSFLFKSGLFIFLGQNDFSEQKPFSTPALQEEKNGYNPLPQSLGVRRV